MINIEDIKKEIIKDYDVVFDDPQDVNYHSVKDFLVTSIDSVIEEIKKEQDKNIGFLRQWLNEDRITDPDKMVTNEEINKLLNK